MAIRTQIEDQTTVTSGGGTSTSETVQLSDDESLHIQMQGDANSTDLTFTIMGKVDGIDEWAQLDELANVDLTTNQNNNQLEPYDVLDLEGFRVITTNNAASDTVIDLIVSHSDQQ